LLAAHSQRTIGAAALVMVQLVCLLRLGHGAEIGQPRSRDDWCNRCRCCRRSNKGSDEQDGRLSYAFPVAQRHDNEQQSADAPPYFKSIMLACYWARLLSWIRRVSSDERIADTPNRPGSMQFSSKLSFLAGSPFEWRRR
jgi:hypothetical protein